MPDPYRPVLKPAGLKHPRVQEFLAVKRRPASGGLVGLVTLEGTWMIGQAMFAGVRLQAVFMCPTLLQSADELAAVKKAVDMDRPVLIEVPVGRMPRPAFWPPRKNPTKYQR